MRQNQWVQYDASRLSLERLKYPGRWWAIWQGFAVLLRQCLDVVRTCRKAMSPNLGKRAPVNLFR